jgi:hypothetical protein
VAIGAGQSRAIIGPVVNPGEVVGFGSIAVGLTILLVSLVLSAIRRLRNLPDDPRTIRLLIVLGLILCAAGVIVGALAVGIH